MITIIRLRKIGSQNVSLDTERSISQYYKCSFVFTFIDGDLGYYGTSLTAYMKQKHRMIWERRHGKIGSGRKDKEEAI